MSLHFVIDGYNITNHRQFPRQSRKTRGSPYSLAILIQTNNLCGSQKNKVILVFDGYAPQPKAEQQDSRISLVFSEDISADEKIKQLIEEPADRKNTIVVSDDKEIISFARLCRVKTMSAEEFIGRPQGAAKGKPIAKQEAKEGLNYSQTAKINEELKKIWLE